MELVSPPVVSARCCAGVCANAAGLWAGRKAGSSVLADAVARLLVRIRDRGRAAAGHCGRQLHRRLPLGFPGCRLPHHRQRFRAALSHYACLELSSAGHLALV